MNLVDFDEGTRNLVVSNQFWLYFVISIPLTALTSACWNWNSSRRRVGNVIKMEELEKDIYELGKV
jgi:hypothetical protein